MSNKKVIFIDMDGVIVDFANEFESIQKSQKLPPHLIESPDLIDGIFLNPEPIDGALDAIFNLNQSDKYDLFIATTSPWENPDSLTHKRLWIERYFGDIFKKKMFITHRKDMLIGDYLIDDRLKNGAENFKGSLLRFGWDYENGKWNEYKNWEQILDFLL